MRNAGYYRGDCPVSGNALLGYRRVQFAERLAYRAEGDRMPPW
jgi:hypothetical protein